MSNIACSDKKSSFEKLLETNQSVPNTKERYRSLQQRYSKVIETLHRPFSVNYSQMKILNITCIIKKLKEPSNISVFNTAIKNWKTQNCLCRLSEESISYLGFI